MAVVKTSTLVAVVVMAQPEMAVREMNGMDDVCALQLQRANVTMSDIKPASTPLDDMRKAVEACVVAFQQGSEPTLQELGACIPGSDEIKKGFVEKVVRPRYDKFVEDSGGNKEKLVETIIKDFPAPKKQ